MSGTFGDVARLAVKAPAPGVARRQGPHDPLFPVPVQETTSVPFGDVASPNRYDRVSVHGGPRAVCLSWMTNCFGVGHDQR